MTRSGTELEIVCREPAASENADAEREEGYQSTTPPRAEQNDWRTRFNVGWVTTEKDVTESLDLNIAEYSSRLGRSMYNFIVFPVGGVVRSFWKYTSENPEPPRINLPDMQLQNHLWETYITGQISSWIDCDSDDEVLSKLSEEELLKELNYMAYMGLRTVIVSLKHTNSPRLAAVISKWLWTKHASYLIWVIVPTSVQQLAKEMDDQRDVWNVWADFRKLCGNYNDARFQVGIHISAELDDEFLDVKLLERWKAEPVGAFVVDTDAFMTEKRSQSESAFLPTAHANALRAMWMSDAVRLLVLDTMKTAAPPTLCYEYSQAVRLVVKDVMWNRQRNEYTNYPDTNINYADMLQAPLQPLADNLDSGVYNTFEQDPVKYKVYREAVEWAMKDFGEGATRPNTMVLYVLGAGRGPLVTACFEAEHAYNDKHRTKKDRLRLKVYAVEKNPNAYVTLCFMNDRAWKKRVQIIESDMRSLPAKALELGLEQPDLIVSELLGSFGDNELSPECLDGVTPFLKPSTICIPQKYTSYAVPIMSLTMHQVILSSEPNYWHRGMVSHRRVPPSQQPDGSFEAGYRERGRCVNMDQIYVVHLRKFCPVAKTEPVFTFEHPNFAETSNERSHVAEFVVDRTSDIMGFAGYFDMVLYKELKLSIVPETHSPGMISWFSAVIPLRDLHRVNEGDKVRLHMDRKVDKTGVWYEWCIEHENKSGDVVRTPVQNENGENYYMRA